jgi:hypothetical protein
MAIKMVECLDWAATDRPGELLMYAEDLKENGVNLDALWGYLTRDNKARIAAIAKKPAKLKAVLRKLGVKTRLCKGFYVTGQDKTGAMIDTFRKLSSAGINIECAEAMATQGRYAGTIWVGKTDLARAKKVLGIR